jgi:non-lysosomal glucosylceramidase
VSAGWPVVRTYSGDRLARIRMPVGGIGTGCVSLGGRGQLLDWELFNRPSKGFTPDSFFAVHISGEQSRHTRVLELALTDAEFEGPHGSKSPLHGMPRFRSGSFGAAYPLGTVELFDPDLPVTAFLRVFNPLVPGDADASGLPLISYVATMTNISTETITVSVCGSLQHIVGATRHPDGRWELPADNRFEAHNVDGATTLLGIAGDGVDPAAESAGTIALTAVGGVSSRRTAWAGGSWGESLREFWDDFSADGQLGQPDSGTPVPTGSLVLTHRLAPGETGTFPFIVSWHFPNRFGWDGPNGPNVGNHYTRRYADAAAVAADALARLPELEEATLAFVRSVGDLPLVVQDAALSNLAVLKSPVCFRIEDGTFLAWEGANDDSGSCHGSCTHVWNYQYALEGLFPELAWTMREVEFVHSLDEQGRMSFRAGLPLEERGTEWPCAAADGQMGAIARLHRTWLADPDRARLVRLWPGVRRAMEFCWIPLGWDADRDGLMEGCQHNTMDVEYFGPSGVNQSWYLAALAACVALAKEAGDDQFATTCSAILASGATRTEEVLFNGEYYEQQVLPPGSEDRIAPGLRLKFDADSPDVGSDDLTDPDFQIAAACTTDQLAGHTMATLSGLRTGLSGTHVTRALRSIALHNHRDDFAGHVNHLRSYALGDESGLLNGTYPRGGRPRRPFPYCDEVWTGVEYTAAVGLVVDGQVDAALRIVEDVRSRYDGRRRNPFDEVECGHHYVRAMASWGLVESLRASP